MAPNLSELTSLEGEPIANMFPEAQLHPEDEPNERYTPQWLFDALHKEFDFTIDLCATAESAKYPRYFTKEEDALKQDWSGVRGWANVPFDDIWRWCDKAWRSEAEFVAMLVPANRTDRPWWQEHVEPYRDMDQKIRNGLWLHTRFLPDRISFGFPGNPDGKGVGTPMFGCCLLLWEHA